ncbi:hypothetical protein LSAT2_031354 [Lamellibrachia satsuma]|nr:hypothetical protein LSAT2_031354 [Lamellibrachia satsuma]
MTRPILLFNLLSSFVYAVDAQITLPRDPLCACTVNVPLGSKDCGQSCGYGTDDNCVKKSDFLALQTLVRELQQDLATTKAGSRSPAMIKQCSRRGMNDNRESGVIMECNFVKQRDDSVLRVAWNGDLRLIHNGPRGGSCRRWYFTLNGNECGDPKPIDTQLLNNLKVINIHHPNYVEGYCRGLPAGTVRVMWNVGDCTNQSPSYSAGDSYTGWISTVRITVEEVNVEDANENIN